MDVVVFVVIVDVVVFVVIVVDVVVFVVIVSAVSASQYADYLD